MSEKAYKTPQEMEKILNKYFEETPNNRLTITGVYLALGIAKETFYKYDKLPEFSKITKKARMLVENSYELSLRESGRTGDIFALKNFGWTDKTETEISGEGFNGFLKSLKD